jgi:hypothetical protein
MKLPFLNKPVPMHLLLLLTALVLGAGLRLTQLGQVPVSLYWDEAAIGYDAFALASWGRDMHGNPGLQAIFPSYGDYKLPMYIWIDAIFVKVWGTDAWVIRLPSALAGIGLIYLTYLIVYELFSRRRLAGLAALLTAVLPVGIIFSRTGFEGSLAVFFVGLTVYLWLKSRTRPWLLLAASVFAAAAVYSYFSARIVIPLMGLLTLIAFYRQTDWKWRGLFVISFGMWLVFITPIFKSPFYEASNQFRLSTANLSDTGPFAIRSNMYREYAGNGAISRIVHHRYLLQAREIGSHMAAHWDPGYLFFDGDSNLRHGTGRIGLMYAGLLPLLAVGFMTLLRRNPAKAWWLMGLWLASIVPAAIPMEVPHSLRSLNVIIVLPVISALGLWWLVKKKLWWLGGLIGLLIAFEAGLFIHDYLTHYPARSAKAWQSGYGELANYLKENRDQYDQCVIDYPDDRLYLYFLLNGQVHPETLTDAAGFRYERVSSCRFITAEAQDMTPETWLVVADRPMETLVLPTETISNYAGEVVFLIYKGADGQAYMEQER